MLKKSEEHVQQVRGEWHIVDEASVRVALPPADARLPASIFVVREGPAVDTVFVCSSEDAADGTLFTFVPEEDDG